MIWDFLANDIVLCTSITWQSFSVKIIDTQYQKMIGDKIVDTSYSLQQFLAILDAKKFGLINGDYGG